MKNFCLFIFSIFLLAACKNEAESDAAVAVDGDFADFLAFYERFHQDSAYQMEHIVFPLQGFDGSIDSTGQPDPAFRWQREDWALHRPIDTTNFRQGIAPIDDKLIIERIQHKSGSYTIERRFAKMSGEWKLIYYAEQYNFGKN